jgi:chloramphenicol 3-O-phosphotransferase
MSLDELFRISSRREALAPVLASPGLRAVSSVRNGRRRDIRVSSSDGRAWLVVVWEDAEDSGRVESVTVIERPMPFRGRSGGLVVVLNGPSSVGKSSLMRAFADRATTPVACLDEPHFGRLPVAFGAWPDTVGPHAQGVIAGLAAAAAVGNQFVVSAAGLPHAWFRAALDEAHTCYVGLDAPIDELVRRQLGQVDKFGGLAEGSMRVHAGWRYDLRIDTVTHDPDAAAELLAAHVGIDLVARRVNF